MKKIEVLKSNKLLYRAFLAVISIGAYLCLLLLLIAFEKGDDNASIHSLWDAIWYSLVTLTTVGYGDMSPVTLRGQIIGYIFVFGSLGVIGFLLGSLLSILADIKENRRLGRYGCRFMDHVVIVGWNRFTHSVLEQLDNAGVDAVVVTHNKDEIDVIYEHFDPKNVFVLYSEYEKYAYIKSKSNLDEAFCMFINLGEDTENLVFLINYKQEFNSELKFPIVIDNEELYETFDHAGADSIVFKDDIASKLIASYIFEPDVALYSEELLSYTKDDDNFDVKEYLVTAENVFLNKSYDDVFFEIRDRYGSVLVGIVKNKDGKDVVLKNPSDESIIIEQGDYLILITCGAVEERLYEGLRVEEGSQ